jgi:uncharacterized protein (DUF362 family)
MTNTMCSRRKALSVIGAAAGAWIARPAAVLARSASAERVAVGLCPDYGAQVASTLATMFDQIGGLESLVRGKTVAIKLNLTGGTTNRLDNNPQSLSHWVHPEVVAATVHLMGKAGARRIRLLESPGTVETIEEFMSQANWNPRDFTSAAPRVEFENTNFLGNGKTYSRFMVPGAALMFKGYDLNHSYEDCDVFVSMAKLKEHSTAGVTLSMKNCFGITPCTIYGDSSPADEPSLTPKGGRGGIHDGNHLPPKSAPPLADTHGFYTKDPGYRVPRVTADLVTARPVHLAIIDGVYSMAGGEGPWCKHHVLVHPGVLVAGRNCVGTDAVGTALMGFDPMADRGTAPFETSDSTLRLAEDMGLGTRDLNRIEIVGAPIAKARMDFRAAWSARG